MSSFSSNNGSNNSNAAQARVAEQTAQKRTSYMTNADGDIVGHNYAVPKGNFSAFLGYKPPSADELSGKAPLAGHRVLEVALQKEFGEVGKGAAERSNDYINLFATGDSFNNKPGREKDMIKDGIEAARVGLDNNSTQQGNKEAAAGGAPGQQAAESGPKPGGSAMDQYFNRMERMQSKSHNDNVRYLEMQYKFQEMTKQDSIISNLMKTRHDCVSRVVRGGGQ